MSGAASSAGPSSSRGVSARFCSAACRITWNRANASGQLTGDTPLTWSVSALEETVERLCKAEAMNLPEALAVISEAIWWVTLVDATMVRYHHDAYDHALADLDDSDRNITEGTFTGLRFVRNCMGHYLDPADFIQPRQDSLGGDARSPPGRGGKYPPRYPPRCRSAPEHGKPAATCITVSASPTGQPARPFTGGSQCRQAVTDVGRRPATIGAGRWLIRRRPAIVRDRPIAPCKRQVSGSNPLTGSTW
jgi:hypothetical protein